MTVLGQDEVGLDVLDAQVNGQPVGLQRVLRQVPAGCVNGVDWGGCGGPSGEISVRIDCDLTAVGPGAAEPWPPKPLGVRASPSHGYTFIRRGSKLTAAVRNHVGPLARREHQAVRPREGHDAVVAAADGPGLPDGRGARHGGHLAAAGEGEEEEEEEEEGQHGYGMGVEGGGREAPNTAVLVAAWCARSTVCGQERQS